MCGVNSLELFIYKGTDMLLEINKRMLSEGKYTTKDKKEMAKIASLDNPNDYDLYLIACALCNYDIPEKEEALKLRMELFQKTRNSGIDYSHKEKEYSKKEVKSAIGITCKNTKTRNKKYGHYLYEISKNDPYIVSTLWSHKDCIKYIDNKTYSDRIIVSIARDQLEGFMGVLDQLGISYNKVNMMDGVVYKNKAHNTLIPLEELTLPFRPYEYQLEDAQTMLNTKRMLNGSDMGTGKTLVSILVGESMTNIPKLVICPESLRLNWRKEILQARKDADVHILYHSDKEVVMGKDWTICGYKTAVKFEKVLSTKCLIVDECHKCKAVDNWGNPTTKQAKAVMRIADKAEYCYLLSGTPMPSKNKDLYNILKMLKCDAFDFNNKGVFWQFANRFCDPKTVEFRKYNPKTRKVEDKQVKNYEGSSNTDELHNILKKVMIRRLKKVVLPNLTKQRQFIPIEAKFKKDYLDIERRVNMPEEGDTFMSLAMTGRRLLSKYKVDSAIDFADNILDSGESVVIVADFIETVEELKAHYKDDCCFIIGGMSEKEKEKAKEEFQSGKKKVCVLNLKAGGVGHTLTRAKTMIVIDYEWLPGDMVQVEDRICRTGQTDECMIYYIYCEKSIFDNYFIDMITSKSENIDKVVDNSENNYNLVDKLNELKGTDNDGREEQERNNSIMYDSSNNDSPDYGNDFLAQIGLF